MIVRLLQHMPDTVQSCEWMLKLNTSKPFILDMHCVCVVTVTIHFDDTFKAA